MDQRLKTGGGLDALADTDASDGASDAFVGRILGDYRLIRLVAEGGMGRVYLAERMDGSFERQVAIKISPHGAISQELKRRFLLEQGLLASLNHPNIAQLYDAKVTDEGWPYFVMEYVDGGPISEYCGARNLDLRAKIRMLIRVVDAVAFAHSRLIVHRDIKPSNVLVTSAGEPKLLDFGIAKLLEDDRQAMTRVVPLTPRYASPEQLLDQTITVGTDVFQLGLLIAELLGDEPLDTSVSLAEAIDRAAKQEDLQLGADLRRDLPRDVACIIEQCLRASPAHRYREASALADDLRRFLDGYPVQAAGTSATYRLKRFVRRNWVPVSATVLLIAGILGALVQSNVQRSRVEQARSNLEQVTEFQAQLIRRLEPSTMGQQLFEDLIDRVAADVGLPDADSQRQIAEIERSIRNVNFTDLARNLIDSNILEGAESSVDEQFDDQPIVAAELHNTLADIYMQLGNLEKAAELRLRVLEVRKDVLGAEHPETLISVNDMGSLMFELGRFEQAETYFRQAYEARRVTLGESHPDTLVSLNDIGNVLIDLNRKEEAETILKDVLETEIEMHGTRNERVFATQINLGYLYYVTGRVTDAIPLFTSALEGQKETLGPNDPDTIMSMNNLAGLLEDVGRKPEAEALYREALELSRSVLGEEHPDTMVILNNLASRLRLDSRLEEAEPLMRLASEGFANSMGPDHPEVLKMRGNYAAVLNDLNRPEQAVEILEESLETSASVLPPEHEIIGILLARYGRSLSMLGRYEEADAALHRGYDIMMNSVGAGADRKRTFFEYFIDHYDRWGKAAVADEYREELAAL